MNRRESLTGEVKKFEDAIMEDPNRVPENSLRFIDELQAFYTQPFTPDMIELFEGWELIPQMKGSPNAKMDFMGYCSNGTLALEYVSDEDIDNIVEKKFSPMPKTLSDFIDACLNSDIKLTWVK